MELVSPLSAEDCLVQSMDDVSPTKWHLAHTTWFFETFVLENQPAFQPYDPRFRVLFNSYYNAVGEQHPRPKRGLVSRPRLEEVLAYREAVDAKVSALLDHDDLDEDLRRVVEVGLQHEQQHQELILMDIKHVFSCNPDRPAYRDLSVAPEVRPPDSQWILFDGGLRDIGHAGQAFAFDNETPRHKAFVGAFALASRLVTVGEYREFMADGGYEMPELWLSDGWATIQAHDWKAPLYWEPEGRIHTLGGVRDLRDDEPVCHVSYYEADAFASWREARLPTEAEWEIAAATLEVDGNFVESDFLHPAPTASPSLTQMFGDVWEWTSSPYVAYPGYRPLAGALGEYNGKFMSNQMVLRGGCCVSPQSHLRATYRNFFPPHSRWQFGGLRLARDV